MKGFLLFDIDGVIRDVSQSYRLAIQETVKHFTDWSPPTEKIDQLKGEGCWNNDWDLSMELIKRYKESKNISPEIPNKAKLVKVFTDFYFGGDPLGAQTEWSGFILNEKLLVKKSFFEALSSKGIVWGFFSGAESESAKFVLEKRLGLSNVPLIAMNEAPNKPDPTGLLNLAKQLAGKSLGLGVPPVAYIGDTVADILTVINARKAVPTQKFLSIGIAPPHVQTTRRESTLIAYEERLKLAGADKIIRSMKELSGLFKNLN